MRRDADLARRRLSGLLMMLRLAGCAELTAVKQECLAGNRADPVRQ